MNAKEEQEAELEALEAIFAEEFRVLEQQSTDGARFEIDLVDDVSETVRFRLVITHTHEYPAQVPVVVVHAIEGLPTSKRKQLQNHMEKEAKEFAKDNMASAFSLCESAKEWVGIHVVGTVEKDKFADDTDDDGNKGRFETLDATQGEKVEVISSKAMGTPVTVESFEIWQLQFLANVHEMKVENKVTKNVNNKMSGREFFESKAVVVSSESESFWENEASLFEGAEI